MQLGINARLLDGIDLAATEPKTIDGRNLWSPLSAADKRVDRRESHPAVLAGRQVPGFVDQLEAAIGHRRGQCPAIAGSGDPVPLSPQRTSAGISTAASRPAA